MTTTAAWKFIAIGPMCYGIGTTEAQAVALMRKNRPFARPGQPCPYRVYECHPESTVSTFDGSISYPLPHPPRLVKEVKAKK